MFKVSPNEENIEAPVDYTDSDPNLGISPESKEKKVIDSIQPAPSKGSAMDNNRSSNIIPEASQTVSGRRSTDGFTLVHKKKLNMSIPTAQRDSINVGSFAVNLPSLRGIKKILRLKRVYFCGS